jgi:hypothetical protein
MRQPKVYQQWLAKLLIGSQQIGLQTLTMLMTLPESQTTFFLIHVQEEKQLKHWKFTPVMRQKLGLTFFRIVNQIIAVDFN